MRNMHQNISSGVGKNVFWKLIIKVVYTSVIIFLCIITEKKRKILNDCIEEWHTSTPYDIFWNQSTYPTVCLLLDMWHRTDHFITVDGKCIFDSNFEVAFPLTKDCLNYTCRGNDTDDIKFVGVLYAIRAVPHEFFKED